MAFNETPESAGKCWIRKNYIITKEAPVGDIIKVTRFGYKKRIMRAYGSLEILFGRLI